MMDRITTTALIACLIVLLGMKVAGAGVQCVDELDCEMQFEEMKQRIDELEADVEQLEDATDILDRYDWSEEE